MPKQKQNKSSIELIDEALDAAQNLVAFCRKLGKVQVGEYYQSLTDRKAKFDIKGKSGWTYIYQHQDEYVTALAKLACRYRMFSAAVAKKGKGAKVKPLDSAMNAWKKLTTTEKTAFKKLAGLKNA